MTLDWKRLLFHLLTAILAVALVEATLVGLTWTSPKIAQLLAPPWPTVPDDRLGHRPSPGVLDHDSRGWRNAAAYEKADIVVLGDSQTYGQGVQAMEAWPRQLE